MCCGFLLFRWWFGFVCRDAPIWWVCRSGLAVLVLSLDVLVCWLLILGFVEVSWLVNLVFVGSFMVGFLFGVSEAVVLGLEFEFCAGWLFGLWVACIREDVSVLFIGLDDEFVIACVWFDCSARAFLVDAVVFALLGVALRFAGFWFVV